MWDPTQPLGRMDPKWYQSKALDKGYTETTLVLGNTEKGTFKKQNLGTGLGPVWVRVERENVEGPVSRMGRLVSC